MPEFSGNVLEPDIHVVIVANGVQGDLVASRPCTVKHLHGCTTANEQSIASQEVLP